MIDRKDQAQSIPSFHKYQLVTFSKLKGVFKKFLCRMYNIRRIVFPQRIDVSATGDLFAGDPTLGNDVFLDVVGVGVPSLLTKKKGF